MSLLLQLIITNSNFLEQLKANIVLCIPYISVNFIDSVLGQCSAENVLHSRVQLLLREKMNKESLRRCNFSIRLTRT